MAFDDRLRRRLQRQADEAKADTQRSLQDVRRKRQASNNRGRLADGLALILIALVTLAVAPFVLNQLAAPPNPPTPPPTQIPSVAPASPTSPVSIVGSYAADLSGAGEPLASAGHAGRWQISFQSDGTLTWTGPGDLGTAFGNPVDTYQVFAGSLTTNFLRNVCRGVGVGSYTWSRSGPTLTITVVEDGCAERRAILTTAAWTSQ